MGTQGKASYCPLGPVSRADGKLSAQDANQVRAEVLPCWPHLHTQDPPSLEAQASQLRMSEPQQAMGREGGRSSPSPDHTTHWCVGLCPGPLPRPIPPQSQIGLGVT